MAEASDKAFCSGLDRVGRQTLTFGGSGGISLCEFKERGFEG